MTQDRTPAKPGEARKAGEPAKAGETTPDTARSAQGEIDAFVRQVRSLGPAATGQDRGRLIFALDATMSRQPTWDTACQLQADMFRETAAIGGLDVQLVYFRGFNECRASKWVSDPAALAGLMSRIDCRGGHTQIRKVLQHAQAETEERRVQALVYVGDCMEEDVDELCALAGRLGLLGVPAFMFQEGGDPRAERAFREIARLTRGAWCRFDAGAASQLRALLSAVAVYAAGGHRALENHARRAGREAQLLIAQLKR